MAAEATTTAKAPSKAKPHLEGKAKPQPSIAEEEAEPGDHSVQEYGTEAEGTEAEEVVAAMRAFFAALAAAHYDKLCTTIAGSTRAQLEQFSQAAAKVTRRCPALLAKLLAPAAAAEARKAAKATISKVRIGEGNAFVLFRPPGGKLSYFVMKEEDGTWKATGLSAGTPLVP
jgi:hypothetical protein